MLCIMDPRLTRIILTSNKINSIPLPPNSIPQGENACPTGNGASIHSHPSCMLSVRHLGVQENLIANWEDMEGLGEWLPTLESLSINGNPLAEGVSAFASLCSIIMLENKCENSLPFSHKPTIKRISTFISGRTPLQHFDDQKDKPWALGEIVLIGSVCSFWLAVISSHIFASVSCNGPTAKLCQVIKG